MVCIHIKRIDINYDRDYINDLLIPIEKIVIITLLA